MAAHLLLLLMIASQAVPDQAPDALVVCPPAFRQALQPWIDYRTSQGHVLTTISNAQSAEALRRQVRETAQGGRLKFVVLVGNAAPGLDKDLAPKGNGIPAFYEKAKVNLLWGSEPTIATDNAYADLNDDRAPEVAIGRLTADSPEQLRLIVAKILAYEQSADFGSWRRQLNFVAGMGGFGAIADTVIESAARMLLTQNIPAAYQVSMTYGSWTSPYCPDPRLFHAATLERLNEGALFWVYIGHASPTMVSRLHMPDKDYPILDVSDVSKLRNVHSEPIAVFLACYTGAFDLNPNCLAAEMLRQPGGPVAVLAGSRVTMPYAMTVLGTGLLDEVFQKHCPTIGEAVLHCKQRMMKGSAEATGQRLVLDAIASVVSPAPKQLAEERVEHVQMFNLFGDPLMRLHFAREIELNVAAAAAPGGKLKVTGVSPVDGRGIVELVVRRGRLSFTPPPRSEYPKTSPALDEMQEVYRKANDLRLCSMAVAVSGGKFEVELAVPRDVEGSCHVRAFIEGPGDCALGAAEVKIEPVKKP
jgi:hypothetical protein